MIDQDRPVRHAKVKKLLRDGEIEEAVALCTHDHVGALNMPVTTGDSRHGPRRKGYRCFGCGAHVDGLHGAVLHTR